MTSLKVTLDRVLHSQAYKDWEAKNKGFYLCSFFRIIGNSEEENWQLDFYNHKSDTITSFIASDEPRLLQEGSKVFKADNQKLNELKIDNVNIDISHALIAVDKLINNKYSGEVPNKKIVILQNIGKAIWNISYLTSSFNILNVKIDAKTGEVLHDDMKNALSFKA